MYFMLELQKQRRLCTALKYPQYKEPLEGEACQRARCKKTFLICSLLQVRKFWGRGTRLGTKQKTTTRG